MSVTLSGNCSLHLHQPALSPLSEREQRFIILFFINHYTFSIKVMMRIVKIILIDWEVPIFITSEPSWAPKAWSEAWRHTPKFSLPTIYLGPAGRRPAWAYDDDDYDYEPDSLPNLVDQVWPLSPRWGFHQLRLLKGIDLRHTITYYKRREDLLNCKWPKDIRYLVKVRGRFIFMFFLFISVWRDGWLLLWLPSWHWRLSCRPASPPPSAVRQ